MATLRYLGSSSLQLTIGDTLGISQASVSRIVTNVCMALVRHLEEHIKWPENLNNTMNDFFVTAGFPRVVGVIDGCHIRILEPKNNANDFINRKFYPSINICAVCDPTCKFTFASIRWPGSCHDSFILRQTTLFNQYENNEKNGFILADSGYPCRKWIMTPYRNPQTQSQMLYNNALSKTRVKIECAFGLLKRRFRILHDEMRVTPEKAPLLISAAMILHNIAITLNMPVFEDENDEDNEDVNDYLAGMTWENGFQVRDHIANTFFR
ncbi:UNVERIFIED_CONTAM: hypothetical protein GTU68_041549 [Idotea baltica]|nr:hypothetical protein [Idotea baltica]